jgi:phosphatidylserine/phosphatidylglycerophosphate/cardiolipin synthase-like enzyme
VRLYFSKNLHAKCYLNEDKMIIASMNLYEFSQQNNREMGILIDTSNEHDKQVYDDATKDIDSIIHNSEDFSYAKVPQKKSPNVKTEEKKKFNTSKSKLLRTKELSQKTGISSRKINSWFVDNKLMYKKDDEWYTTKKGKEQGGIEKDGFYEQEVLWPEEIAIEIHKNE